jgi:HAD superfamily hydrolase (TIGR01490 family)
VAIAFFDLDKTLLAANTAREWLKRELRQGGTLSRWQALRAAGRLFQYSLGFASLDDTVRRAIAALAGRDERHVRDNTVAFYQSYVRHLFRPGGRLAVQKHRGEGDSVVLLTASSSYLSELVAQDLSLDAVLCNRFEVDAKGLYTGKSVGSICFGQGKLAHAAEFAEKRGVGLKNCTFYTDSYSDLPVLKAVGKPCAVNPDARLRREALRQGWPILDWGVPEPVVSP